jgi:hypothetical protein
LALPLGQLGQPKDEPDADDARWKMRGMALELAIVRCHPGIGASRIGILHGWYELEVITIQESWLAVKVTGMESPIGFIDIRHY